MNQQVEEEQEVSDAKKQSKKIEWLDSDIDENEISSGEDEEEAVEAEIEENLAGSTAAKRTIFATNLPLKMEDKEVTQFFA